MYNKNFDVVLNEVSIYGPKGFLMKNRKRYLVICVYSLSKCVLVLLDVIFTTNTSNEALSNAQPVQKCNIFSLSSIKLTTWSKNIFMLEPQAVNTICAAALIKKCFIF